MLETERNWNAIKIGIENIMREKEAEERRRENREQHYLLYSDRLFVYIVFCVTSFITIIVCLLQYVIKKKKEKKKRRNGRATESDVMPSSGSRFPLHWRWWDGWAVHGKISSGSGTRCGNFQYFTLVTLKKDYLDILHDMVKKHWQIDNFGIKRGDSTHIQRR
ncbi:hypothetical protein NQ315_003995 [Exocentrus adspersus]|uniref:Uncharacterized protein n=1 Tax=Exocentrus adspersus TaxID=1586481 RepID=A0AAV8V5N2_9CUCU|nr:hypothetical protein NQ315_003995 [Exocentrus adspersus]